MTTTAAPTAQPTPHEEEQHPAVTAVVLVAIAVTIYVAFFTPLLEGVTILGQLGFCVIVPGIIGGTLNAILSSARRSDTR